MKQLENQQQAENPETVDTETTASESQPARKSSYLLPLFLFIVLLGLLAAAGYWGWQQFLLYQMKNQQAISELQAQLTSRPTRAQMDSAIQPLKQASGKTDQVIAELQQQQQSLLDSTQKLYELYGRDENGWKLAEVEYLMSIAQHKLVLEQDFEGAATTLDAASQRIAQLADPGLLPVRVKINDEIAELKTRARPDLVGMTLLVARLSRQINVLTPEYVANKKKLPTRTQATDTATGDADLPLDQRVKNFLSSLVTIKTNKPQNANQSEVTQIIDVRQKLEDNLKLTRWTILERDARQFDKLMAENIKLFSDYYDLQDSANADFYASLMQLQKSSLKAELPDISGSLRLLQQIQQKRENAPQQEAGNG
jgi:uncharacterized protein HemX